MHPAQLCCPVRLAHHSKTREGGNVFSVDNSLWRHQNRIRWPPTWVQKFATGTMAFSVPLPIGPQFNGQPLASVVAERPVWSSVESQAFQQLRRLARIV